MIKFKLTILFITFLFIKLEICISLNYGDTIVLSATKHFSEKLSQQKYLYHVMKWCKDSINSICVPNVYGIPTNIKKYDIYYYSLIADQVTSINLSADDKKIYELTRQHDDSSSIHKDIQNSYIILIIGKSESGKRYYALNHNCNLDFSNEKFIEYKNIDLQIKDEIFYKKKQIM
jgi:hypothetical protein